MKFILADKVFFFPSSFHEVNGNMYHDFDMLDTSYFFLT